MHDSLKYSSVDNLHEGTLWKFNDFFNIHQ